MKRIGRWLGRILPVAAVAALAWSFPAAGAQPAATQPADPVAASMITLHMKDAPAREVYRALFKQAGAPLRTDPDNLFSSPFGPIPSLTIDVDNQPFWEVIKQVDDKTRLSLLNLGSDIRLAHASPIFPGPTSASGAFLFVATNFVATVHLTAKANTPNSAPPAPAKGLNVGCQLVIEVYYEPKLKILKMAPTMKVDEAVDDNGNSLVPDHSHAAANPGLPSGSDWPQIAAELQFPSKNPGKRIKYVRGTETFVIAGDDGKPRQVIVPIELIDLDMNLKGE